MDASGTVISEFVSTEADIALTTGHTVYECVDGSCIKAYGYVINNEKVYAVTPSSIDDVTSTRVDSSIENEIECSDDNVGKILKDKSAVCLRAGKSIKMEKNNMKYLMKGGELLTGTISGAVKSGEGYVVVDGFISEGKYLKED